MDVQQDYAGQLLQPCNAPGLQALTRYTYVVDAINTLCSEQSHITSLLYVQSYRKKYLLINGCQRHQALDLGVAYHN
jgi:hypothetical protein